MISNERVIRQYLKDVSSKLECNRAMKSVSISDLKNNIILFAEDRTCLSIEDLYSEFGTPEEITDGFFGRKD